MALSTGLPPNASLSGDELDCVFESLSRSRGEFSWRQLLGISPIALCSLAGGLRGFEALLAAGADLSAANEAGEGLLVLALSRRSEPMARRLLALAREGRVPVGPQALCRAVAWGWREGIEALIDMGVDVNASSHGATPIAIAARRDFPWALRLLAHAGANIDSLHPCGTTALMISADMGRVATMEGIIALGADVEAVDGLGRSAVWRLALKRNTSAMELLLASGARPDKLPTFLPHGPRLLTALGRAARSGNDAAMRALLAAGADPSFAGWAGDRSPVRVDVLGAWARGARREPGDISPQNFSECLRLAIKASASLDHVDEKGCWPLWAAALGPKIFPGAVEMLVAAGASIETKDAAGETLLDKLMARGNHFHGEAHALRMAEFLLSRGAEVTPALRSAIALGNARLFPQMRELLRSAALAQDERRELGSLPLASRSGSPRM